MKQSSDITNFTDDELEIKCTEYLRGTGYHNRTSQEKPKVTVLGGLAGSGKSYYIATLKDTYAIIGDEYRLKHPRFNQIKELYGDEWVLKTNEFSAAMINKIADQALKDKKNVVIEGTFRTYEAPANTLKKFKDAGYETHAHVVLCHKAIAKASTVERYEKMKASGSPARKVCDKKFQEMLRNLAQTSDKLKASGLVQTFTITARRDLNQFVQVYTEDSIQPPSEIINGEMNRALTIKEKGFVAEICNKQLEALKNLKPDFRQEKELDRGRQLERSR